MFLVHVEEADGFVDTHYNGAKSFIRVKRIIVWPADADELFEYKKYAHDIVKEINSIDTSNQEQVIMRLNLIYKLHKKATQYFPLLCKHSQLLHLNYKHASEYHIDTMDPTLKDPTIYPDQDRMRRVRKASRNAIIEFKLLVVCYLKENPRMLFTLPVETICEFLEKHNTYSLTVYAGKLSRKYWLDISISNVVMNKYNDYKVGLVNLLVKCLSLPNDICCLIAMFLSETFTKPLNGRKFVDFMRDKNFKRGGNYHMNLTRHFGRLQANYDVVLYDCFV